MDTIARTRLEIELRLRLRLIPRTDNRAALVDLGFAPAYPQLAHDAHYGAIWTRAVAAQHDSKPGHRSDLKTLAIERAFYDVGDRGPRRNALRPLCSRRRLDVESVLSVRIISHRGPPDRADTAEVGTLIVESSTPMPLSTR